MIAYKCEGCGVEECFCEGCGVEIMEEEQCYCTICDVPFCHHCESDKGGVCLSCEDEYDILNQDE